MKNPFSLTGTVTDESGNPLIGASLKIEGTDRGAVTDLEGKYTILYIAPGKAVISASQIEHITSKETLSFTIANDTFKNGRLHKNFTLRYGVERCFYYDSARAFHDIEKDSINFPLGGFVTPSITRNDRDFQKKYHVRYAMFGCIMDASPCEHFYNNVVFEYLDKKYGREWRNSVHEQMKYWVEQIPYKK